MEFLSARYYDRSSTFFTGLIECLQRNHERIDTDVLSKNVVCPCVRQNRFVAELCQKQYLRIRFDRSRYISELNVPFEQEFKRPLKQCEKGSINIWRQTTGNKSIMYA